MALRCVPVSVCLAVRPFARVDDTWLPTQTQYFVPSVHAQVSPLFDRHQTGMSSSQIGFIDFVVAPLYFTLRKMFPAPIEPLIRNMVCGVWRVA